MPSLDRSAVQTSQAPRAIGPYSQAIRAGDLIFCSGQIGLDPASAELVGADAVAQTRQIMTNLSAVLHAAGADLSRVVKTTIFLVDLADFARVNEAYAESFPGTPPARSTVQVAALPKGARVEIEAVAVR